MSASFGEGAAMVVEMAMVANMVAMMWNCIVAIWYLMSYLVEMEIRD